MLYILIVMARGGGYVPLDVQSNEKLSNIEKCSDESTEKFLMIRLKALIRLMKNIMKLVYQNHIRELSDSELMYMLSSGTTKGVLLYIFAQVAALENGFDLLIDEVENHFQLMFYENDFPLHQLKDQIHFPKLQLQKYKAILPLLYH